MMEVDCKYTLTETHSNITIMYCIFANNSIADGAGLLIYSLTDYNYTKVSIANSEISNNSISGIGGGVTIYLNSNTHIINSTITNNIGVGLKIFTHTYACKSINIYLSQLTISNNSDSGILASCRCTVVISKGNSIIANNSSPNNGGGIYLDNESYLTTSDNGHVSFINNTAKGFGGAIYSLSNDNAAYMRGILYYDANRCTVYNLAGTFISNSADKAGDALYGGRFIACAHRSSIVDISQYVLGCPLVPTAITNSTSMHPLSKVSSDPIVVCPCNNDTVNCFVRELKRVIYPGQILSLPVATVGLCGGITPGTVSMKESKGVNLIYDITTTYTATSCAMLRYTVKLTDYNISTAILTIDVADGMLYNSVGHIAVSLTIQPCPVGLVLDLMSGGCICNKNITRTISEALCNISWMPYPIQRSGNNWISHQYDKYNCIIAHSGCPFDYCNTSSVKFSLDESDLQCNYNRSGILCGQCKQGFSLMIGSNKCANCTDTTLVSLSIIIVGAVAGLLLVAFLIILNLTVSIGSINGLLLYANIVKSSESIFFPQGNLPVISQFIAWCNLDLGIEYCFIDGLDGYIKTWLQFSFPLYVWILVIVIIVACRYSGKLSRLIGHNAVPVLATLILMSYTKLLRAISNALMMTTIHCGKHKWNVWNVDGNVDYLSGKHIALFTVSLLFLVIGLIYTVLVLSSQWLQRYSGKCCKSTRDPVVYLKPLIDAYTGPFKDKYRFWTGLGLMVHVMVTVVFSFTTTLQSKLNNYIILLTVGAIMSFFVIGDRVYKDKRLTILETFSYLNLGCLSLMVILFTESYHDIVSVDVIVSISVSIEMLLFFIIVIAHCYIALKKVFSKYKLCCKIRAHVPSEEELPLIIGDAEETGKVQREELLFDRYLNKKHS